MDFYLSSCLLEDFIKIFRWLEYKGSKKFVNSTLEGQEKSQLHR